MFAKGGNGHGSVKCRRLVEKSLSQLIKNGICISDKSFINFSTQLASLFRLLLLAMAFLLPN